MTGAQVQAFLVLWRNDLKAMRDGTYKPPKPHPRVSGDRFDPEYRSQEMAERSERIKALYAGGMRAEDIASRVCLTTARIYQILRGK